MNYCKTVKGVEGDPFELTFDLTDVTIAVSSDSIGESLSLSTETQHLQVKVSDIEKAIKTARENRKAKEKKDE